MKDTEDKQEQVTTNSLLFHGLTNDKAKYKMLLIGNTMLLLGNTKRYFELVAARVAVAGI